MKLLPERSWRPWRRHWKPLASTGWCVAWRHRSLLSPPAGARLGLIVDVDTTGADLRGDEAIELAMILVAYTPEGEVLGTVDNFQG